MALISVDINDSAKLKDLNLPRLAARFGFAGGRVPPERGGHVLRARTRIAPAG